MCGGPVSSKQMEKREREYMAEDDLRTLERAEEVRQDKSRMQRASAFGRKRVSALRRVMGGRPAQRRSRGR